MAAQESRRMDISGHRRINPQALSFERFISSFGILLKEELEFRKQNGLEVAPLETYYENVLFRGGRLCPVGLTGYTARLAPALREIQNLPTSAHILDAGCGYGTESLVFSLFGQQVTGIELVPERFRLASSRVDFYQDFSPHPLNLRFQNAHVLRFLQKSPAFDLVWAMEAISHIHPADDFLSLAYRRLKDGGKLVISDPNRLNPLAWARSVRIRGSIRERTHTKFTDPETGIPVNYGQELIFSPFILVKKLVKIGFKIQKIQMSGFMGSSLMPKSILDHGQIQSVLIFSQKILQRAPVLRYFGSVYTIVAIKS